MFSDGVASKTLSCSIAKAASSVTCANKTYTGSSQTIATSSYCTLSGQNQTNAGSYTVSCTGDANHNNSSNTCSISKINSTMNLSATSGNVQKGSSFSVTVSGTGYGTLSCTSSDTSIATCSVSGSTVTIIGTGGGNVTITISGSGGTNYNAISKTVSATITDGYTVSFNSNGGNSTPASITVYNGGTYGTLPSVSKSDSGSQIYDFDGWYTVDGTRIYSSTTVNLSANQTLYAHWSTRYRVSSGYYMPAYSTTPQTCPSGYYCCPNGCITGYSSSDFGKNQCPSGYTSDLGAKKESDCYINVPGGMKITTAGSSELKNCTGYGSRYMPAHKVYYGNVTQGEVAGECLRCPDGQQANNNSDGCITCKAGYYCPGFLYECPEGTTSSSGAKSISECSSCPKGYYCTYNGNGTLPIPCPSGTYGASTGLKRASECSSCPSGYTSSSGSTSQSDCYVSRSCGQRVKQNSTPDSCANGYYSSSSGTVYYGSSYTCTKCSGTVSSNKCSCN